MIVKICAPKLLVLAIMMMNLKKLQIKIQIVRDYARAPSFDHICYFYCWLSRCRSAPFIIFLDWPTELAACDFVDFYYFWCDFLDFIKKNKIITEIMNEIGFGCVVVNSLSLH